MRRTLLNDVVFKIVFGSPKNEPILRSLLNAILNLTGADRIVQLTLLNPELSKPSVLARGAILDLRAKDGCGRQYNIEVQLREQIHYVQRSLYYLTKLYSEQLKSGDEYEKLRRTVAISILDFPLFPKHIPLHTRFRFHDREHDLELSDILEVHYLELAKLRLEQPLGTPLEKWLHALKFAELYSQGLVQLPEPIQEEQEIVMALEEMDNAYERDEIRHIIDSLEKAERDEISRRNHAIREATAKAEAKIARFETRATKLKAQIADAKAQLTDAKAQLTEAEAQLTEAEAQVTEAKAKTAEAETKTAEAAQQIARSLADQGVDAETIFRATGIRLAN